MSRSCVAPQWHVYASGLRYTRAAGRRKTSSAMDRRTSSPPVTRTQAVLAQVAALMVGLLDPLHLVGLEGRLGEVQ